MFRTSPFSHWVLFGAVLGAWQLAAPGGALAQSSASETAHVTQLFKNGKAAFAKSDMVEAERLFAEAYALRQSSDIAANLGQSELEQQKFRSAAEHFQWALANLLPSATDVQRKAVETGLARSRAEVALLRFDIKPEGSEVLVGEQNVGKAPIADGVYVDPGEVIVSVRHEGFIAIDKRVMVGKGSELGVEVALTPKPNAAPAGGAVSIVDSGLEHRAGSAPGASDAPPSKPKSLVPAFIATGVAVAGGVTGLVLTLSASSKASDADKLRDSLNAQGGCVGGAPENACRDLKDQRSSVDTSRNIALGAVVVGGVAALAGGYFYWDALRHRESASRARPLYGFKPALDVERARNDAASIQAVKLSLSGTF